MRQATPVSVAARQAAPGSVAAARPLSDAVHFGYFGQTGITVTGPHTSKVYRFAANSAPVVVDPRDAAALSRVPNLRMLRGT